MSRILLFMFTPCSRIPSAVLQGPAALDILPDGGWTSVYVQVLNAGTAAASGVRFSVTLPPELQESGSMTTNQWDCSGEGRTTTCAFVGDLAAGAEPYGLSLTAGVSGATVGGASDVTAEASTTSPDANAANDTDRQTLTYVGKGIVKTQFWNDLNADGLRQPGEPAVDPGGISVRSVGDDDLYGGANTFDGQYSEQVPAKEYYAEVEVQTSRWLFTTPDAGDDRVDSDFTPNGENQYFQTARTEPFTVTDGGTVQVDRGVVAVAAVS
ncbi:DUF11 domain-containing protein [Amycolatopsis sp. DSM 110486]|uniref:DUF11 domain-containing protein n=1 Tax=Amycolatopsis sp. DSM 110486 TaxID=2865832 RepID=UPI001C6A3766|nr:DUF11 domain-containing protein [Amycolatopsis sp. DSM 110486]QYN19699.1 DUF11 domain-containing protein [Amycolatopsis sp. DSM 110486]